MNHRTFSRVEVRHRANLVYEGESLAVQLENAGLGGFFLRGPSALEVGRSCEIEIQLQRESPPIALRATARVRRVQADGVAIEIERIGFQELRLLRQLVAYNCGDGDLVHAEETSAEGSSRLRSLFTSGDH